MKILTVCEGGNTRSVTLATLLKYYHGGHDALAMSWAKQGDDTKKMLYTWANRILVVDQWLYDEVRAELEKWKFSYDLHYNLVLIPIGQDRWGQSMHPGLVPIATKLLNDAGFHSAKSFDEVVAKTKQHELKYLMRRAEAEAKGELVGES